MFVPNTLRAGADVGAGFAARAADVTGSIRLDSTGRSESDWYSFAGTAGDRVTIEVLSRALNRLADTIDSIVTVWYKVDGNLVPVPYYGSPVGAQGDDNIENQDAQLIDLPLSVTGTYYVQVDAWAPTTADGQVVVSADTDTGDYELFVYGLTPVGADGQPTVSGDAITAQSGDTVVASSGRDTVTIDGASVQLVRLAFAPPAAVQPGSEGMPVTVPLGSFVDAAGAGPWAVSVNWGDGSTAATFTADAPGDLGGLEHTFPRSGAVAVTVKVTNALGLSSSQSFPVPVANVAPTLTAPAAQAAGTAVSQAFDLGSLADVPGDGPWVITVDWNDGTTSQFAYGATGSITGLKHTYRHTSAPASRTRSR